MIPFNTCHPFPPSTIATVATQQATTITRTPTDEMRLLHVFFLLTLARSRNYSLQVMRTPNWNNYDSRRLQWSRIWLSCLYGMYISCLCFSVKSSDDNTALWRLSLAHHSGATYSAVRPLLLAMSMFCGCLSQLLTDRIQYPVEFNSRKNSMNKIEHNKVPSKWNQDPVEFDSRKNRMNNFQTIIDVIQEQQWSSNPCS